MTSFISTAGESVIVPDELSMFLEECNQALKDEGLWLDVKEVEDFTDHVRTNNGLIKQYEDSTKNSVKDLLKTLEVRLTDTNDRLKAAQKYSTEISADVKNIEEQLQTIEQSNMDNAKGNEELQESIRCHRELCSLVKKVGSVVLKDVELISNMKH